MGDLSGGWEVIVQIRIFKIQRSSLDFYHKLILYSSSTYFIKSNITLMSLHETYRMKEGTWHWEHASVSDQIRSCMQCSQSPPPTHTPTGRHYLQFSDERTDLRQLIECIQVVNCTAGICCPVCVSCTGQGWGRTGGVWGTGFTHSSVLILCTPQVPQPFRGASTPVTTPPLPRACGGWGRWLTAL